MRRDDVADFPSANITGWNTYCECGHRGRVRMADHPHLTTTGQIWRALRCSVCGRGRPDVRVYVSAAAIAGDPDPSR